MNYDEICRIVISKYHYNSCIGSTIDILTRYRELLLDLESKSYQLSGGLYKNSTFSNYHDYPLFSCLSSSLLLIVVVCRDKQFLQQSAFKWLFFLIVSRPQYCRDCTKIFVLSLTVLLSSVHKLKRRSMETHIFQTKCSCWVLN